MGTCATLLVMAAIAAAPDAPVTAVTVYSDRARVTRTAQYRGGGAVEFPPLQELIDTSSIRVEAEGAQVSRVDVERTAEDELPAADAQRLLAELEGIDERTMKLQQEREAYQQQVQVLSSVRPAQAARDPLKPAPKLDPTGWKDSLAFVTDRLGKAQQQLRERDVQLEELFRQRLKVAEEAQKLGVVDRQPGWKVVARIQGPGPAKVSLTYLTANARWYPRYDIQLDAAKSQVQLAFYGLVSQETGEDWNDAALVLSTAMPATTVQLPKLLTWKIGERDRFIPTPSPMTERVRPPPPAVPPVEVADLETHLLRDRLMARAAGRGLSTPEQDVAALKLEQSRSLGSGVATPPPPPSRPRPSNAPSARGGRPAAAPPPAAVDMPMDELEAAPSVSEDFTKNVAQAAPGRSAGSYRRSFESIAPASKVGTPAAVQGFALAPPPSYVAPQYAADLPASRAGGYDLAFPSAQKETVEAGKGPHRVALFAETWPVKLERRVFPALAPYAFLVAELKSPSERVLPGGDAALFVGADPAGNAQLDVVSPGQTFTLPLGVDRAIKPVRNVTLAQAEQGFIGKDDVGEYTVTIEIANPYSTPLPLTIADQWPLQGNEKAELKLLKVEPAAAKRDDAKGSLEWKITLPPSGKSKVSFTYSLQRPKGWRLEQAQEAAR